MKAILCFLGVDMRMGHQGLEAYAKTKGVNLKEMQEQTACVFFSRNKMRIKTYTWNGVVCYLRSSDSKRPFSVESLDEFPRAFNQNGTMNYAKALKASLEKRLKTPLLEEELLK